jgi:hypothetical protein
MKNTLKAAALTLAMASPLASAQDVPVSIFMDLNSIINGTSDVNDVNYDTGLVTDIFQIFSTVAFNPVSTYTDLGNDGITTGDLVHDEGTGISILGLNPLTHSSQEGGFGDAWGLQVSWSLDGVAGVFQDANWTDGSNGVEQFNYLGNFLSGTFTLDVVELDVNNGNVVNTFSGLDMSFSHMEFSPSNPTSISNNEAVVDFFADVDTAVADTFFFSNGEDFFDVLADGRDIDVKVGGDLADIGQEPQQVGQSNVYTRSTSLDSFDVSVVPEPTSVAIMGLGLLGLGLSRKRKQK